MRRSCPSSGPSWNRCAPSGTHRSFRDPERTGATGTREPARGTAAAGLHSDRRPSGGGGQRAPDGGRGLRGGP
ncbi:hypothetical protein ACFFX0_06745 [Citricoccus parietis]|uniref:Uncharacterized protein n=1 Tax=Citricoccus parietis TaxID=592307 RepID=A0ABV5FW43_9MICC